MNLQEYFESVGVEYWESGKNVTQGWVNIECLFCDDVSNHLGINLKTGFYSCWICGAKGYLPDLMTYLENISYKEAKKKVKSIDLGESGDLLPSRDTATSPGFFSGLPKTSSTKFPKKHLKYLRERNFNPSSLIKKYRLLSCHTAGVYRFRIIIPFFYEGRIVTFTSLDVTNKQEPKYLHCSIKDSEVDPKHMLYNIDSVNTRAVVVEGVTDVWRIGDGTVGTMGTEYVWEQIDLLAQKNIESALVVFDSDAVDKGEDFAVQLSGVIPKVDIIELKSGDPDTLKPAKIKQLQRFIKKG